MTNKVCVYTVCKDESKFVDQFCDSALEADVVCAVVHDTKDDTAEKLIARGVKVAFTHYQNWRFDVSKNDALKWAKEAAPDCNIFAFVSLDEVFDNGWAQLLRDNWKPEHEICLYKFVQSHDDNGRDALTTGFNWIHNRDDAWYWKYPVDEVLKRDDKPVEDLVYLNLFDQLTLHHWADYSKPRPYVDLHKIRYEEDPVDTSVLCLVRDYRWMGAWDEMDDIMKDRDIDKMDLTPEEKSFIVMSQGDKEYSRENTVGAIELYNKAIELCSSYRDPYIQYAILLCNMKFYSEAEAVMSKCFEKSYRSYSYLEDPNNWDAIPYTWMAVALFYQNKFIESFAYATLAKEKNSFDDLAKSNYDICLNRLKEVFR